MVGCGWGAVVQVRFAQYQNIVSATEWIPVDGNWMQIQIGIGAIGLVR